MIRYYSMECVHANTQKTYYYSVCMEVETVNLMFIYYDWFETLDKVRLMMEHGYCVLQVPQCRYN